MPFLPDDKVLWRCYGCVNKWVGSTSRLPTREGDNWHTCDICWSANGMQYQTIGGGWN